MAAETPTIVLVHGAWADATGFDAEIRALQDRGYSAIGFGNPLRDLAGDAAYLADQVLTSRPVRSEVFRRFEEETDVREMPGLWTEAAARPAGRAV